MEVPQKPSSEPNTLRSIERVLPNMTQQIDLQQMGSTPRCHVACLDVLGFTKALQNDVHSLFQAYYVAIDMAQRTVESYTFVQKYPGVTHIDGSRPEGSEVLEFPHIEKVAVFSDSIFVFTKTESPDALTNLCEYCFLIYRKFLSLGLPLRGGIASGEAIVQPQSNIFLGQAIVDAWQIEQSLDLTGIVLDQNLESPATTEAEASFRDKCRRAKWKESRRVPLHRAGLVQADDNDIRNYQVARAQAGPQFEERYKNSVSVVAAMFKMRPDQRMQLDG